MTSQITHTKFLMSYLNWNKLLLNNSCENLKTGKQNIPVIIFKQMIKNETIRDK